MEIQLGFDPRLHLFLGAAHRAAEARVRCDGVSSLGHVVESLGVPLTEVGALRVGGRPVAAAHVPSAGERIEVGAVRLPQQSPHAGVPLRFLLDVHLGTLARRMRLLGLDAAYENPDIGDGALAAKSAAEQRIMLPRDRGLLRRRELFGGAFVYSHRPAQQLDEVLTRFVPPLAPWTRCTACNGELRRVARRPCAAGPFQVPQRTYQTFAECSACGHTYWRGAHAERLDEIVQHALGHVKVAGSAANAAA